MSINFDGPFIMTDEYLSRLRHDCITYMETCSDFEYQQMEHMIEIIDALREYQRK